MSERARILAAPFSEAETRDAYQAYALNPGDDSRRQKQKMDFGIRLRTPFESLPSGIQQLVSNPIFLRYLVTSYETVNQELTEGDILTRFYDCNIPPRHRFFLRYFLDLLWFLRRDFLSEDDLHKEPPADDMEIRRSHSKLLEYCWS
jgi:hypothetical protein